MQKFNQTPNGNAGLENSKQTQGPVRNGNKSRRKKRSSILPILLILMGCAVFTFAAWSAVTSPVLASILNISATPQAIQHQSFAQVNIAKPSVAKPIAQDVLPSLTPVLVPTATATQETQPEVVSAPPTDPPTVEALVLPNATDIPPIAAAPESTNEPGVVQAQIIVDTPTSEYVAPTVAPYVAPQVTGGNGGERWIDVNLSQQRTYAYEGDTLVNSFVVSTGTWQTPTVTGKFKIWIKVRSQAMSGPGYYLPDVPFVMYFYKDYGLHGTYWHNNFGTPMSHGCVNLTIPDSEWLYNFASVGTVVNVHY